MAGIRVTEAGVGSRESGVRSQGQEAVVRSQESGGRSHESGVSRQESGVRSQESAEQTQKSNFSKPTSANQPQLLATFSDVSDIGFVYVAPAPIAALERLHDGVLCLVEVSGGMPTG
jgi:hypothetical protein